MDNIIPLHGKQNPAVGFPIAAVLQLINDAVLNNGHSQTLDVKGTLPNGEKIHYAIAIQDGIFVIVHKKEGVIHVPTSSA